MTIKSMIRKWVRENFGESEVNDPSWNIDLLADYIESKLKEKTNKWLDVLNYWDSDVCDCAVRNGCENWYRAYEKVQDEMYNLTKGK